jgi:hypothetical protein
MMRLAKLQLVGPLVLFGAVLAAEGAALALALLPSSELLWHINLKWFVAFQRTHYILHDCIRLHYLQLLGIASPLIALVLVGYASGWQLPLAISSNLSFVYASFVAYAGGQAPRGPQAASLAVVSVPSGPDLYLVVVLLGASLVSFVVSHLLYVRAVRARAPCLPS